MTADHSGPQLWHFGYVDIDLVYHLAADTRVPAKAGDERVEGKPEKSHSVNVDRQCNEKSRVNPIISIGRQSRCCPRQATAIALRSWFYPLHLFITPLSLERPPSQHFSFLMSLLRAPAFSRALARSYATHSTAKR